MKLLLPFTDADGCISPNVLKMKYEYPLIFGISTSIIFTFFLQFVLESAHLHVG